MKVVVAGGGNIGRYLALDLVAREHEVVLVELAEAVAATVGDSSLPVVVGDACAPDVLELAGARGADVLVSATGDDEDNLVISLLGKQEFAVPRVLARVNHPTNEWLFDDDWGVDVAVSPPHLLTSLIEEEVVEGDLVPLLTLERGRVALIEVRLEGRSAGVGARVGDLRVPQDVALVAIVRDGHVVPARSAVLLEEGDEVVALASTERHEELRRLLIG